MRIRAALLIASGLVFAVPALAQTDPLKTADPFVGSEGGGNTVPGAGVPFGFVSVSPDTTHGDTNGYDGWSPVVGFSAVHVSGTGGNSKYGNFRVTPSAGSFNPRNLAFHREHEQASPGYYSVDVSTRNQQNPIHVELTATRMVAVERFTFPADMPGNVLIDATSAVQLMGGGPRSTGAHVETHADGSVSGWASFHGGWNTADYKLYFVAVFDRVPAVTGTWTASQGQSETQLGVRVADSGDQRSNLANRLGAVATFDSPQPVILKLAVSFVSEDRAREHLSTEAPGWDFDAMRTSAEKQWNGVLSTIDVEGGTPDQRRQFYSALYRVHTMPHDLSGDHVWWQSDEPHYEDFYAIWDTFRGVHPLLTLIEPQRQRDIVRSLLDTYKHDGWLPDARVAGATGLTQGGSNGDVVIADAVVKKLGGFDLNLAYEAVKKDADIDSPDQMNFGRSLKNYVALGYMPLSETRSGSRTVEYSYNDFAAAQVALASGHKDDALRWLKRSASWQKLWDDKLGCIHPRYADGSWLENYDCAYTYPDNTTPWWDAPFYEGSGYQYSTFVPHDIPGLIAKTGGREAFAAWLDRLFDGGHYDQGNEPDILAPYLYIAAGRPDRTADRVRRILADKYHPTSHGLPGNDDAGAMSAWYVWSAIGLYPNAGQPLYYIGSPLFSRSVVHLEGGKTFTIFARQTSDSNRYVLSAKLNGKALDRAWLTHDEIVKGGRLELEMGAVPGTWATRP